MNEDTDAVRQLAAEANCLLQRYFERSIDDRQCARLIELWTLYPEFRETAEKNYEIACLLSFQARVEQTQYAPLDFEELIRLTVQSPSIPVNRPKPVAATRKKKPKPKTSRPESYRLLQFSLLLLAALIVAVAYQEWWRPKHGDQRFDFANKPQTPAVMVDMADVQWNGTVPKLGEPLQPGQLAFESGTVELLFFNGVRSIIEGPAELTLLNESRVFCNRGKWSVTVPPSGVGFELQTPGSTIRDLGTQFYAAIDGKNSDVHVLKGAVEVINGRKTLLKTNEAVKMRGSEILDRMPNVADLFVPKTEMRRRSSDYWQRNLPPPSAKLEPILFVDFSHENPEGVTLSSVQRVQGRSQKKTAVRLTGNDSRIQLPPLGKLSTFTVLVDVRVDKVKGGFSPILMSGGMKPGGIIWNIGSNGAMVCGFRRAAAAGTEAFETPIIFTKELLGEWVQLGLSVDKERGRMSVFLNGDPICSKRLPSRGAQDLSELDVAAWKLKNSAFQLDGAVERIIVFNRALELHEIRNQQKPEWSAAQ